MPILKKDIKNDFTIVHNAFIRDEELGIDGRGLLLTMLSMKNGWHFSIKGLASILPDGEHKVGTTLKKLESLGYLRRKRITNKKGKIVEWEYAFSDEPVFRSNDTSENPDCGFPDVDNPDMGNPDVENRNDNKILNNQIPNNQVLSNLSISTESFDALPNRIDEIDSYTHYKTLVYSNIEYDIITENNPDKLKIDEIVENMLEMLCCTSSTIRLSGSDISTEIVRSRLLKIDSGHIEYILLCLKRNTTKVRNIKSYLRTVIYNAPSTIDNFYESEVNNALSG